MAKRTEDREHYVIYDSISLSKTLSLIENYLQDELANKDEAELFLKYILEVIVRDLETSKFIVIENRKWVDIAALKTPIVSNPEIKDFRLDLLLKIARLLFENENEVIATSSPIKYRLT